MASLLALHARLLEENSPILPVFLREITNLTRRYEEPTPDRDAAGVETNVDAVPEIRVFCDGACSGNPGPGGWGCVVITNGLETPLMGGERATTNNRMELTGAIEALQYVQTNVKERFPLSVTTDSRYVKDGITSWIKGWKRNGWLTAAKEPVKNADLWKRLDALDAALKPEWRWVKGHSNNTYNEKCDQMAVKQRDLYAKS